MGFVIISVVQSCLAGLQCYVIFFQSYHVLSSYHVLDCFFAWIHSDFHSAWIHSDFHNLEEFSLPMHIRCGTQWNVVSRGCPSCIKMNFADEEMLFLVVHSGVIPTKNELNFVMNFKFKVFEMESEWRQKFWSFFLWNGTTVCSLHFVLNG